MVDVGTYAFKDLNKGKTSPEESFTNAYIKGVYESEKVHSDAKQLCIILYVKYNKGMFT